jgi:hypothetical protein
MATQLVRNARDYLLSFDGVDDRTIDEHLRAWKDKKKHSLRELYRSLLNHAKNRQSMPNTIGDIEKLENVLFGFNPVKVRRAYGDHFALLREIKKQKIQTPAKIDVQNNRSHWVIYAKSAVTSAHFLSRFKSPSEFHSFVESFYTNEYSRLALPLLLKEELPGFGFALSCDFLKENGYSGFLKPDTHVNDICRAAGLTVAKTDFGVFKDLVAYCNRHKLIPYEFDKLIWLVGSGNFYLRDMRIPTKKSNFIAKYLQ